MSDSFHPHSPAHGPDDLLSYLEQIGVVATTVEHAPLHTVEQSRALRGDIPGVHCKSLFLKDGKGSLWLIVAREDSLVDLRRLPAVIGSARLSFGRPELLSDVLGVVPGSVTPFAVINDTAGQVRVVLEQALLLAELINFHPLVNTRTTTLSPTGLMDFLRSVNHPPLVVDLADIS